MGNDTFILLGLLITALSWFFVIHIKEERQFVKKCIKEAQDNLDRAERIRRLTNKP